MKKDGFTVLEMILVLSVISLIFLITLPNIQQKEQIIRKKGCEALVEVVNSQILLYEIDTCLLYTSFFTAVPQSRRCKIRALIIIRRLFYRVS